jgi:hypothetical protein
VTNVSQHGFWLLINGREQFVPFKQFPWFREVSIGALCNVELPHPGHLNWRDLDIDLAVESVQHPKRFPPVSRVRPTSRCSRSGLRGRPGSTSGQEAAGAAERRRWAEEPTE